jgi:hypothetical protein
MWDNHAHQFRRVVLTAVVVTIAVIANYVADVDRDPVGWLFTVAFALCGLALAFWLVRRLR